MDEKGGDFLKFQISAGSVRCRVFVSRRLCCLGVRVGTDISMGSGSFFFCKAQKS